MPGSATPRTPIDRLAQSLDLRLVPLGKGFSYFALATIPEEDLREYVHEPIDALPPAICELIAPVRVVLTPYLERTEGNAVPETSSECPPEERRLRSAYLINEGATLFFSVREEHPSEYHQSFFNTVAHLVSRKLPADLHGRYVELLTTEFQEQVHGEVDEASWERKQALPRRNNGAAPSMKSKAFRDYAEQSFIDTLTLYLHGICCDIDVETGPRQMPGKWLRKRLDVLYGMFPPPQGRPVFPEHLSRR